MKPVQAWAVIGRRGKLRSVCLYGKPDIKALTRIGCYRDGERAVRVEIRELKPKRVPRKVK